jgi:hypothetical protein
MYQIIYGFNDKPGVYRAIMTSDLETALNAARWYMYTYGWAYIEQRKDQKWVKIGLDVISEIYLNNQSKQYGIK